MAQAGCLGAFVLPILVYKHPEPCVSPNKALNAARCCAPPDVSPAAHRVLLRVGAMGIGRGAGMGPAPLAMVGTDPLVAPASPQADGPHSVQQRFIAMEVSMERGCHGHPRQAIPLGLGHVSSQSIPHPSAGPSGTKTSLLHRVKVPGPHGLRYPLVMVFHHGACCQKDPFPTATLAVVPLPSPGSSSRAAPMQPVGRAQPPLPAPGPAQMSSSVTRQ